MTYPLIERTYFKTEQQAWGFARLISNLEHHIVRDYGYDNTKADEPYFIETANDPFSTKNELLKRVGLMD